MRTTLNNLPHDFGGTVVLTNATGAIIPGDRIGIVGPNGSGKTTLIRIITGDLEPVSGAVVRQSDTRIGYVPQHLETHDATTVGDLLLHHVREMREQLREIELAMGTVEAGDENRLASVLKRYQAARQPYDAVEGDSAEGRASRLLDELGLPGGLAQEIRTLSGGERNVLSLARALVEQPNLLVLDEPGNHLDFAGLAWLESFLSGFSGAVIVVSHNRYLLDKVATSIWEIFGHRVSAHTGNYSDFRFGRLTQAMSDQATHSVQERTIARLEALVKTFEQRARTTGDPKWGKRLRARRTQLAKTRELALDRPEIAEKSIQVRFTNGTAKSDIAIHVQDYSRGFGEHALFDGADFLVHVGERVGIVGPNGSGKTTFLTDLVKRGNWDDHTLRVGPSMRVGYCAQQRNRFDTQTTVLDAMLSEGNFTRNEVFGVVSRLLFEWEDLERTVSSLSGGEWNRLQLGMAVIAKANLLILDEPTNHLDIQSREAVEEALAEFAGTIIAVSHDRYFLDAAVNRIVEIKELGFASYDGTFTEYWFERASGTRITDASLERRGKQTGRHAAKGGANDERGGGGNRGRFANRGGTRDPAAHDESRIESEILKLEERQRELERLMTEALTTGSQRDGRKHAKDLEKVRSRIEELYARWGTR